MADIKMFQILFFVSNSVDNLIKKKKWKYR